MMQTFNCSKLIQLSLNTWKSVSICDRNYIIFVFRKELYSHSGQSKLWACIQKCLKNCNKVELCVEAKKRKNFQLDQKNVQYIKYRAKNIQRFAALEPPRRNFSAKFVKLILRAQVANHLREGTTHSCGRGLQSTQLNRFALNSPSALEELTNILYNRYVYVCVSGSICQCVSL